MKANYYCLGIVIKTILLLKDSINTLRHFFVNLSTRKSSCFPPCCMLESKAEVSFKNGQIVKYGTEGIVRLDVVLFDEWNNIICTCDLKTGSARLTAERINEIIQVVGKGVLRFLK